MSDPAKVVFSQTKTLQSHNRLINNLSMILHYITPEKSHLFYNKRQQLLYQAKVNILSQGQRYSKR